MWGFYLFFLSQLRYLAGSLSPAGRIPGCWSAVSELEAHSQCVRSIYSPASSFAQWAYRQDTDTAGFSSIDFILWFTPAPKEQTKPGLRIPHLCSFSGEVVSQAQALRGKWEQMWGLMSSRCFILSVFPVSQYPCLLGHRSVVQSDQGKAHLVAFSLSVLIDLGTFS